MKTFALIAMMLVSTVSFSQQLKYSHGQILNSRGTDLNKKELLALLAKEPGLMNYYKDIQLRRNMGGFMIGLGGGMMLGDLVLAIYKDVPYPGVMTFVGAGTALLSIPVMTGHRNRLRKFVDEYNKEIARDQSRSAIDNIEFVVNQNGAGLRIQF